MYLNSTKQRREFVSGMFVRNVTKDLKQHELSMHITSRVGKNSPKIDMIRVTEWCCVGNVIMHSTENTNLRH